MSNHTIRFSEANILDSARDILKGLDPEEIKYAADPARGEFRGFAALHDLMDANELLPQFGDFSAPVVEFWNAVMTEVSSRICA